MRYILGRGSYGIVFKGYFSFFGYGRKEVVVKRFKEVLCLLNVVNFFEEVVML